MPRALALAFVLLAVLPGTASGATRYAAPGGSQLTSCLDPDEPCEISRAVNNALSGDEVIVAPGDYGSPAAPITTTIATSVGNVDVHGATGQPRPRIFAVQPMQGVALRIAGAGSTVRRLRIDLLAGPGGSKQIGVQLESTTGDELTVHNSAAEGRACVVLGNALLRNSLCRATATNARGIATYTGVGPGGPNTSTLRNVTALATGSGSMGIQAFAGNAATDVQSLTVSNAVARGPTGGADVGADNAGMGEARVTIDHSNFGFVSSLPVGSGIRVNDGPSGGNQRFGTVAFSGPDFHQAASSMTIDAGADSALNGPLDFDGDRRSIGVGGTDIGADEFVFAPRAVTGAASATPATAVLNGTVNPNTMPATYRFEYGRTTAYGSSTPSRSAGSGGAAVPVRETIGGLTAGATYHYRLVATGPGGVSRGADRTLVATTPGGGGGAGAGASPSFLAGGLGMRPRTFRAAARGGSVRQTGRRRRRAPIGTTVRFRVSEAANVRFTVQRARPGKRVRRRCVRPRPRNRRAQRCTRWVRVRGSFRVQGASGQNAFRFTGRLRRRKLAPGRYRLVAVATDNDGNRSAPRRVRFRIVRR